jgi:hypothetical protein
MLFVSSAYTVGGLVALAAVVACSQGGGGSTSTLGEHTGGVTLKFTSIPADVHCVEVDTSDYGTPRVRVDVAPSTQANVAIAPLKPGDVYLWGTAYNESCEALASGGDGGSEGGAYSNVSWTANGTDVQVYPGTYTQAELTFHQLGGVDVGVNFDNCIDGGSGSNCADGGDAGLFGLTMAPRN